MNTFMNAMVKETIKKTTENGANAVSTTGTKLYDLFALGAAYRNRSEEDCILLFKEAYEENPEYALKCLWYIRDVLEGQGERRFFRVCLKWLANHDSDAVIRNLNTIANEGFGRWDDLFVLFDTPCEQAMLRVVEEQLVFDLKAYNLNLTVSLLAKWLPSENSSSAQTKQYARRFIQHFQITPREYRKMLSCLRERIKVVERLMSQNRWEEIDFSHLPSRAGLIYREAFTRHDIIKEKYEKFAHDENTTVNAKTLYPYDVVRKAQKVMRSPIEDTSRVMVNKYWDNLNNVFPEYTDFNGMVVCDTSASMTWSGIGIVSPIDVAASLAIYAAERAHGPFANHYISFSHNARFVEVKGVDFCDKVRRIIETDLRENTNLESVFDLLMTTAVKNNVRPEDMPKNLVIISDMEVDSATYFTPNASFMQQIRNKWLYYCGTKYEFPKVTYWNVNARNNTFIDDSKTGITLASGCSPVLFTQLMTGVSGQILMYEKLNSERYQKIA